MSRVWQIRLDIHLGRAEHGLAIIGHWPSILKRPVDSSENPYAINQWLALSPAGPTHRSYGKFNHSVITVYPREIRGYRYLRKRRRSCRQKPSPVGTFPIGYGSDFIPHSANKTGYKVKLSKYLFHTAIWPTASRLFHRSTDIQRDRYLDNDLIVNMISRAYERRR